MWIKFPACFVRYVLLLNIIRPKFNMLDRVQFYNYYDFNISANKLYAD